MRKKCKYAYMHIIDGRPAAFDGEQICYAGLTYFPASLVTTLKKIKNEQKATIKFRNKRNYRIDVEYGYIKVLIKPL